MKKITPVSPSQGRFLDTLRDTYGFKNDAALCRAIGLAPPVLSKMRHGRLGIGSSVILAVHEQLGMSVAAIRAELRP